MMQVSSQSYVPQQSENDQGEFLIPHLTDEQMEMGGTQVTRARSVLR